jgi:hypothetical protein
MDGSRARMRRLALVTAVVAGCTGSIAPAGQRGSSGDAPTPPRTGTPGSKPGPGGTPTPSEPGPSAPATGVVPAGLRRLTGAQLRSTLRDLFGPSVTLPMELDRDDPDALFGPVGGYRVATSAAGVLKYDDAAYAVAHQVFADPKLVAATVGCDPKQPPCAGTFVRSFGRRAWRRPLLDEEVARYIKVAEDVARELGSPEAGLEFALAGLLQSPNFIYVPELGESDGGGARGRLRFTSHEMAARLSYLLVGSLPDAELATAADKGALVTPAGLKAQVERLLAAPGARPVLLQFFGELFGLAEIDSLSKDADVYPGATPALFAAMREEVLRLAGETALDRRNALLDLLDLKEAFVNADLAKLYGVRAPAGAAWDRVPLGAETERAGVLTTGAWLSILAKPYSSSPTFRGVFVREKLLCQDVPAPPANVDNNLPPPSERKGPPATTRQVLEQHRKDPVCATCHAAFDPLGVAFERFDGLGAHRTSENGLPIDTSGELDGKPYKNVGELIALLKADPRVGDCLLRHAFHYVSGHQGFAGEDGLLAAMAPGFRSKPDFRDLLLAMLTSDWFRYPGAQP